MNAPLFDNDRVCSANSSCVPRQWNSTENTSPYLCRRSKALQLWRLSLFFQGYLFKYQASVEKDTWFECLQIKTDSEPTRLMLVSRLRRTHPTRNMSSSTSDSKCSKMNKHKCLLAIVDDCLSHLSKKESGCCCVSFPRCIYINACIMSCQGKVRDRFSLYCSIA